MVAYEHGGRPCPVLQQDKMHTEALDCIVAAISAIEDGRDVARGIDRMLSGRPVAQA